MLGEVVNLATSWLGMLKWEHKQEHIILASVCFTRGFQK